MIAIITAIISGIAMSVQGVFNTRLGEKIGVWETNVFVQGSALILLLLFLWVREATIKLKRPINYIY